MRFENYPLLGHNTFGIDVKADSFVEYTSEEGLLSLIAGGEIKEPHLHIGSGSNLLFTKDFNGTVLHSAIKGIESTESSDEYETLTVGAGVVWDDFVDYCVSRGLYGAENLSLIPGEVGSAAVQNIGAYGAEVSDIITAVHTISMDGVRRVFTRNECEYSYRHSIFKRSDMKRVFVTKVEMRLCKRGTLKLDYGALRSELEKLGGEPTLRQVRDTIIDIRRRKLPDPAEIGNAGSFFINPTATAEWYEAAKERFPDMPCYRLPDGNVKIPAGWLIEQCGWKGKALGRAGVYSKQALVLINLGDATGDEIVKLSDTVRKAVAEKFGIEINPEVNIY